MIDDKLVQKDYEAYRPEEREYMRGFHAGKREAYQRTRSIALGVAFVLMGLSLKTFCILYGLSVLVMAYFSFKKDEKSKWFHRILGAFSDGILWPFVLWQEAQKECFPPKEKGVL